MPLRPSTLCEPSPRCRIFYTNREKLMGKLFPTRHPSPREVTCTQRNDLRNSSTLCSRSIAKKRVFRVNLARWFVLQPTLATLPLHDGSKSTKVDTVWSMRYTGCTNLGNRGPS
jgi:hypothetical protein